MGNEVSTNVKGREVAAGILPKLFSDIDFGSLNSTIEALAKSESLTPEQRTDAIKIVDSWNHSVVTKLSAHEEEISSFILFITNKDEGFRSYRNDPVSRFGEDRLDSMAKATATTELLSKYLEARDHYDDLVDTAPATVDYTDDPDLTIAQIKMLEIEAIKERKQYDLNLQRARNTEKKALREWVSALNKNEGIREMVNKGRRYSSQVKVFTEECRIKAQAAKLNLSIPDADIRAALTELLEFGRTI